MYEAVIDSRNVPAVWLLDQIGVDKGYRFSKASGIALTEDDRQLASGTGRIEQRCFPACR